MGPVSKALERTLTQPAFDAETLEFYRLEAHAYANRGQSASRDLPAFLARLPRGAGILELGCGGGQDAEAMIAAGFDVTPTDGSAELAAQAEARLGRPVRVLRFDALDVIDRFDAVWANACLLHVPVEALAGVLARVRRALKDGGVFYASFKAGDGPARDGLGRYNNLISLGVLEAAMAEAGPWADVDIAEAPSGSYDGAVYTWLVCTAVKAPQALAGGRDRGSNRAANGTIALPRAPPRAQLGSGSADKRAQAPGAHKAASVGGMASRRIGRGRDCMTDLTAR